MFRYTSRDVLWLMVVVGLSVCWCLDRKRIETERRLMQQDFEDRMTILNEREKDRRREIADAVRNRLPIPSRQSVTP